MTMEWAVSIVVGVCVALLFSLAIFIHEFGHFLAARLLGLQVDAFAIGFGPSIWKKTVKGIEYKIGCIPFGGYVALPQLDPSGMEKVQGEGPGGDADARALPDVAAWKRIVVSVAGPFGNVVLAVALAYLIAFTPGVRTGVVDTRVGTVLEDSAAWEAGLHVGDRIVNVNGHETATWNDLRVEWQLAGDAEKATFGVERAGERLDIAIPLATNNAFGLKLLAGVFPEAKCEIAAIQPDTAAAASGLRVGDVVLALGGVPVVDQSQFIAALGKLGGKPADLVIQRGTERVMMSLTPRFDETLQRWLLGVVFGDSRGEVRMWMMYRDPWQQLKWDSLSVVRVLKALAAPKVKGERMAVAKNIGGPVLILTSLYSSVRDSPIDGLGFLRMICVNLAILNLLPIPVLDGGHIIFALYEITTRRKPHPKVVAVLVNTCAVLLIGLMLLLVYADIARKIKFRRVERELQRQEQGK
ncbi:MAG: RIP metalloprotease RseP [Verrucomicrobiota bacterium]|jgi:regulator of sigma E protease|nr:RIP metalloprotease RseP [Verrucomicrobiota bacterium]